MEKNGPSTDAFTLKTLADKHLVPRLFIEYRHLARLQTNYLQSLPIKVIPSTRRIHGNFNQTVAETGRLSSSDPNLQNIPHRSDLGKKIRSAFVAETSEFALIHADYSQIELRVLV